MQAIQKTIRGMVHRHAALLEKLALTIHANPELGFQESNAVAIQVELLRQHGFTVAVPVAGLKTAFKATVGRGKPVLAILSEYDALPDIGHACGHNLICSTAIGTGVILAELLRQQRLRGTVMVLGTPGEESKGGKVFMLRRGVFKDVQCALMAHPNSRTACDIGNTAVKRFRVEFRGLAAHAAAAPERGLNALDAVMLLFQGINAWRQQLPEHARIHGVIEKGGVAPNIIPDFTSCVFFLRSTDDRELVGMEHRFRNIVRGAALMTGTRPSVRAEAVPYKTLWPNAPLEEAFMQIAAEAGLQPLRPERTGKGSSDFGDVSQAVPGAHFCFGITPNETAIHSVQFAKAAGSAHGIGQMLRMVETLATIGYQYLSDPAFRKGVDADFKERQCKHG